MISLWYLFKSMSFYVFRKFFPHSPPQFYGSHQYRRPMFGKRSTSRDVMLTAEEKFNLKHHRKSRHTFYKQLEKFIDTLVQLIEIQWQNV